MIIVDTNTIAYLYFPTPETAAIEKLLELDGEWAAPQLWRSEFRNILALYVRKEILTFEAAFQMQRQAEQLMAGNEFEIDSFSVLATANESGCSAYDAEFVALAKNLNKKLVTSDKKLLRLFPDVAITARELTIKA